MKKVLITIVIIGSSILAMKIGETIFRTHLENNRSKVLNEFRNNEISTKGKDWTKVEINENLELPKKDSSDWSYPWYMIKHKNGSFENTLGKKITQKDTTKIYHHSFCYSTIQDDTLSRLRFVKGKKNREVIFIKLYEKSASNNEALELEVVNFEKFKAKYNIDFVFPYDSITINFLKKKLEVKDNNSDINDNLIGRIDLDFEQNIFSNNSGNKKIITERKKINGIFEVKIE